VERTRLACRVRRLRRTLLLSPRYSRYRLNPSRLIHSRKKSGCSNRTAAFSKISIVNSYARSPSHETAPGVERDLPWHAVVPRLRDEGGGRVAKTNAALPPNRFVPASCIVRQSLNLPYVLLAATYVNHVNHVCHPPSNLHDSRISIHDSRFNDVTL
jgi:hypothetical protein